MNTITLFIAILSVGFVAHAQVTNSRYNNLVWQDEFNGNSLDRSKWQYEDHCSPQNQELQCYTPRTQNVYVRDGNLHVKSIPETYGNKRFTSGRINTRHSAAWKYGRFEVRAKLPRGDFLWPALWMLPRDYVYGGWAASGEIDIMEYRGQRPRQISNALHYGGEWPNNAHVGSGPLDFNFDFSEGYHIFTLIWERDQMVWYVDGKQVAQRSLTRNWYSGRGKNPYTDIRQPFDQPFFFLINQATGGNFFGAESQSLTTAIGQRWQNPVFMVDYVRVYQEGGANPNPNPVPVPQTSQRVQTSQRAQTSQKPPAQSSGGNNGNNSGACAGKCGAASCCDDQKLGAVCYDAKNYVCETDSRTQKKSLCGKGLGVCNTVCFDKSMYVCGNGGIRLK